VVLSTQVQSFNTAVERLKANSVNMPDHILGMMVLSSLPPWWDHVSAIYLQGKTAITQVKYAEVRTAIVAEFDRVGSSQQQHAHKITAIKRKGEHPRYSNQRDADSSTAHDEGRKEKSKRNKKSKGKGKKRSNDAVVETNPFTLAASATLEPARPVVALQPSRAPPGTSTVASFNSRGVTYAKVAHPTARKYTGAPTAPGRFSLQKERTLLERVGVAPTMEPLRALSHLHPSILEEVQPVASSSRKTLEDILPPPVAHMPNAGKGKKKVPKTILRKELSRPPVVLEVAERQEELDWGSVVESPPRSMWENTPMAQGEDFPSLVDERHVDNYGYDRDGTGGVFDDHFDPRQVTCLTKGITNADDQQQYNDVVDRHIENHVQVDNIIKACIAGRHLRHKITVDINKNYGLSLTNCVT
jgi:hypothetical protein